MLTSITSYGLQLSATCKEILQVAGYVAKENLHSFISPSHLLKALLHKDFSLRKQLETTGKDIYYMEEWVDIRMEELPKSLDFPDEFVPDERLLSVFDEADNVKVELNEEEINPHCLLGALCTPGVAFTYDQLRTFPLTRHEVLQIAGKQKGKSAGIRVPAAANGTEQKNSVSKYIIDKTAELLQHPMHRITGRENELRQITEILSRKTKTNILFKGDNGVGKTALLYGLVQTILDGMVPSLLKDTVVLQLDLVTLAAGASYKGEAEERMKKVLFEIASYERPVLFIDDIHILADRSRGLQGVFDLLKSAVADNSFTVIGAVNPDHFRKHIEPDETIIRHFEIITVAEPDDNTTKKILDEVLPFYEKHHDVKPDDSIKEEAIRLARRFLKERKLPDAAIDLLDRTMAATRTASDTLERQTAFLKSIQEKIKSEKHPAKKEKAVNEFLQTAKKRLGNLVWNRAEREIPHHFADTAGDKFLNYPDDLISVLESPGKIITTVMDKADLAVIVSEKTGIPSGKLQSQEKEKLLAMEQHLAKRVVGQDHALKNIAEAILESRSGLKKAGQPIGSFFFLGPTGTGKTELAKALSEFLFQDERFMIRFDMSEFKEEHSAALLYGAPPGYVGYEEGGMLVNKIRQQPYAVVLFDEIEKAHASLFDVFLQIMDEGKLHDRLGKEGDFSNALVLFTSNIGSQHVVQQFNKGIIPSSAELLELMSRHFRPEFLGRLTEIIPFAPISSKMILDIFTIHVKELVDSLEKKGITFSIDENAKTMLAEKGHSPEYGARPIKGIIRDQLRRPLSRMLVAEKVKSGNKITVGLDADNELKWTIT